VTLFYKKKTRYSDRLLIKLEKLGGKMEKKLNLNSLFLHDKGVEISFLKKEDIVDIKEMLKDKETCKYLFFALEGASSELVDAYFMPIAQGIENSFKDGKLPESVVFILRDSETKEFIGNSGITSVMFVEKNYELGYQISRKYIGKGYGTLSAKIALDYALNYLKAERINADIMEGNIGSKKILVDKLGFKEEGIQRAYYKLLSGERADRELFEFTEKEISNEEKKELEVEFKLI